MALKLVKIKGDTPEHLNAMITAVMNMACVIFGRGQIPTTRDIAEPEKGGQYWYKNTEENKFELLPMLNNHKAFIRDEGELYMTVEFHSRYDRDGEQVRTITELMGAIFQDYQIELITD
jgi:hypothetical protein